MLNSPNSRPAFQPHLGLLVPRRPPMRSNPDPLASPNHLRNSRHQYFRAISICTQNRRPRIQTLLLLSRKSPSLIITRQVFSLLGVYMMFLNDSFTPPRGIHGSDSRATLCAYIAKGEAHEGHHVGQLPLNGGPKGYAAANVLVSFSESIHRVAYTQQLTPQQSPSGKVAHNAPQLATRGPSSSKDILDTKPNAPNAARRSFDHGSGVGKTPAKRVASHRALRGMHGEPDTS